MGRGGEVPKALFYKNIKKLTNAAINETRKKVNYLIIIINTSFMMKQFWRFI